MLCFCTVISFLDIIEELINPTNEDFDFPSYNAMRNVLPRDQLQERIDQVLTIERAHEYCLPTRGFAIRTEGRENQSIREGKYTGKSLFLYLSRPQVSHT